ncbi:MAG: hypothetical protein AB1725_00610 [Armatimonadota bacterium]
MNTLKVISWRVLLVGTVFAVIVAGITAFRNQNQGYDYEASFAKLRRIGQALQLYRQEWGVKPVEERMHASDAGLPPKLTVLSADPNAPWYVPRDTFTVESPNEFSARFETHFQQSYWDAEWEKRLGSMAEFLTARGERLPILVDINGSTAADFVAMPEGGINYVILRLDGSVEVVRHRRQSKHDILWR